MIRMIQMINAWIQIQVILQITSTNVKSNFLRPQMVEVEADTEQPNHGDLTDGLGNGSQVADQLDLRRADPGVLNDDLRIRLVGDDPDVEAQLSLNMLLIRDGFASDLIQGI